MRTLTLREGVGEQKGLPLQMLKMEDVISVPNNPLAASKGQAGKEDKDG